MWIKICGIRDAQTARQIAGLGATALGLNFYPASPRAVSVEAAGEIVRSLPREIEPVGVFVNEPPGAVEAACRRSGIATVQVHGDESPESLAELHRLWPAVKLVRAWRMGPEGLAPLAEHLAACDRLGVRPAACLIEARVDGVYGGSGVRAPWHLLAEQYRHGEWPPLVLAGGLTPENVAEAVAAVRPWGVDVAGGVESSPGRKDLDRVALFIDKAREALGKS